MHQANIDKRLGSIEEAVSIDSFASYLRVFIKFPITD